MKNDWYLSEIEHAVAAPKDADAALLRDVAIAYAEACYETNQRLRAVGELLDLGLRAEAIELADEGQPLLEAVSTLDFPQRGAWVSLLNQLGLEGPPELDLDTAAQLNTAYSELEQLAPMLAKHRLLALARAPLAARVKVLRRLIAADDSIPGWREDIEQYETVRLQEMGKELSAAIRSGDAAAVEGIAAEVREAGWAIEPPPDLVERVFEAEADFERTSAHAQLQELLPRLEAAYGELNAEAMRPIADEWRRLAAVAKLTPNDALAERAAPALEWDNQTREAAAAAEEFQEALGTLEAVLEEGGNADEVRAAFESAARHEQPIPDVLDTRARNRLAALENARKRRFVAGLTAACLTAAGIAIGGGLWWSRALYAEQVAQTVMSLAELLDADDLVAAEGFASRLDEGVAAEPGVASLLKTLDARLAAESDRQQKAEGLLDQLEAMDPATPDTALLDQAKQFVSAPDEQRRLNTVLAAIAGAQEVARRERDQLVGEQQAIWSKLIAEGRAALNERGRLATTAAKLNVEAATAALLPNEPISRSVRETSEKLVESVRELVSLDRQRGKQVEMINAAFAKIGDPEGYRLAWRQFAEAFPRHDAAKTAAAEEEGWRRVLRWDAHWNEYGRELSAKSADDIAEQLIAIDVLLPNDPEKDDPYSARTRTLRNSLLKMKARPEAISKLRVWLRDPMFNVWVVRMNDGELRYCPSAPKELDTGGILFEYWDDDSLAPAPRTSGDIAWHGRAPHAALRDKALELLKEIERDATGWDSGFYTICRDTLRLMETDPEEGTPRAAQVPTLDLFRRFVVVAGEGSVPFADTSKRFMEQINDASIDFQTPWFLPGDIRANAARQEVRRVKPMESDWKRAFTAARADFQQAYVAPAPIEWCAAVDNTSRPGRLRLAADNGLSSGRLVVVTPGASTWYPVGQLREGVAEEASLRGLPTGMPVFLLQP